MKALQLVQHGAPGTLALNEISPPVAVEDEVCVSVRACGLNRLDLWVEEGALPVPIKLPRVPGGEISGVINSVGPKVHEWRVGDRVAIQSNLFCGTCEFCLRGEESICLHGELLGVHRDGGFQEIVKVPSRALVALPDELDFVTSAGLTLAGSTAMHMLTNRIQLRSGQTVLAIGGASGVGSYAIQIAKQLGAKVITTASSAAKADLAKSLGADLVVDSQQPDWPAEVRRGTDKRGVDVIIEHIGGEVFENCFKCLARGGVIVTCGATAGPNVQMNLWPFFVKQQVIIGSYGRTRADIQAVLSWVALKKIKPVIHQTFPLERAPDAFRALRERQVLGKIVVTVN